MNSIRPFLFAAWLMVVFLLWREWSASSPQTASAANVPTIAAAAVPTASPQRSATPAVLPARSAAAAVTPVQLRNDVLSLTLEGDAVTGAALLKYPQSREPGSPPVVLLNRDPARSFVAQAIWRDSQGRLLQWQPQGEAREIVLGPAQQAVQAVFVGSDPAGSVQVQRTFTLARGSYALRVQDVLVNAGNGSWTGDIERRLERVPPQIKSGFTNPESFSLNGAAWYSPQNKYKKRKYPDFTKDGPLDQQVTGGWIALSQHYFLTAWVPQPDQPALFSLGQNGNLYSIQARGPQVTLAPGQRFTSRATLWVGPKLADQLDATAPGLGLAMDYGIFTVLAKPIH